MVSNTLFCILFLDTSVTQLLSSAVLERNRYYLKTLVKIVQFLVVNELSFRGSGEQFMDKEDFDLCFDNSAGNFVNMIKFTASQDSQFEQALRLVPQNAKYTSASIQNEIIFILKDMVLSAISNEMNEQCDLPYYCLKCDGTRDPVNTENLSVIVRYSVDAIVHERLVALSGLEGLSAAHITKQVLEDLQLVGLDPKQILCTCFDGASVMSGSKGGVHALLQKELQKEIPYIHCLNHQLHLVISHVCGKIDEVADMFAACNGLYKFFRKFEVSQLYKGQHLQRLLEIRWTGHLNVCKIILKTILILLKFF